MIEQALNALDPRGTRLPRITRDAKSIAHGVAVPNERGSLHNQTPRAAMRVRWIDPRSRTNRRKSSFAVATPRFLCPAPFKNESMPFHAGFFT